MLSTIVGSILLKPKSGELIWKGKSIHKNLEDYYKQITFVSDKNSSKENLSVIENMNFWKNLYSSSITHEGFMKLLDNLNLRNFMNELAYKL